MATLSSTSSLDDIKAAYADNADYETSVDTAKAATFIVACRLLLLKLPAVAGKGGATLTMNPTLIAGELLYAQRWLKGQQAAAGTGSAATVQLGTDGFYR